MEIGPYMPFLSVCRACIFLQNTYITITYPPYLHCTAPMLQSKVTWLTALEWTPSAFPDSAEEVTVRVTSTATNQQYLRKQHHQQPSHQRLHFYLYIRTYPCSASKRRKYDHQHIIDYMLRGGSVLGLGLCAKTELLFDQTRVVGGDLCQLYLWI